MSGHGAPELKVDTQGLRVAVIAGSWHGEVMGGLIKGARETIVGRGGGSPSCPASPAPSSCRSRRRRPSPTAASMRRFASGSSSGAAPRTSTYISSAVTDGLTRVARAPGRRLRRAHDRR